MVLSHTLKKLNSVICMQLQMKFHSISISVAIRNIQNQDINLFKYTISFYFNIYHVWALNILPTFQKKPFSTNYCIGKKTLRCFSACSFPTLSYYLTEFLVNWTRYEIRTNSNLKKYLLYNFCKIIFAIRFVYSYSKGPKATYSNQENNYTVVIVCSHLYKCLLCIL